MTSIAGRCCPPPPPSFPEATPAQKALITKQLDLIQFDDGEHDADAGLAIVPFAQAPSTDSDGWAPLPQLDDLAEFLDEDDIKGQVVDTPSTQLTPVRPFGFALCWHASSDDEKELYEAAPLDPRHAGILKAMRSQKEMVKTRKKEAVCKKEVVRNKAAVQAGHKAVAQTRRKELLQTRKCLYSRAYHRTYDAEKRKGKDSSVCKVKAQKAARASVAEWLASKTDGS